MNDTRSAHDDALVAADHQARLDALDPSRSFIVQAPAGSGKTELLIQRYLRLLATVDEPEEVVAMTFTRKAAGEMQARVLAALGDADLPAPADAHNRLTGTLARELVAHSARRNWALQAHPSRLAVQTIDAWCAKLTHSAPLSAGMGLVTGVTEDTTTAYVEAARRTVLTQPMPPACVTLLRQLDNQVERLIDLIAGMLAQRDQWLPWLIQAGQQSDLRAQLEENWKAVVEQILGRVNNMLTPPMRAQLLILASYARENLIAAGTVYPGEWPETKHWPPATCEHIVHWKRFASMVLTGDGRKLRKSVDVRNGFPAGNTDSQFDNRKRKQMKAEMTELLAAIEAAPGWVDAFIALQRLPGSSFTAAQWQAIDALLQVLPLAVAQLKLHFAEVDCTDFTEVSLGALQVLGDASSPGDLLLAYDQRIRHVLIDEFQDTSLTQFALVSRLIAGWSEGDGRTVFAVGDPMQSVYRFRGAEVSLFLDARQHGIGAIPLEPLQLRVNFRSDASLVEWVNQTFAQILPAADIPEDGVSGFVSAVACANNSTQGRITRHGVADEAEQGARVVDLIREARSNDPDGSIAILVRARNHLRDVVPALREAGIAWDALDIDPLAGKQQIIDCLALTHALLEPADRLAWLALLRAPWCGLTLVDLTLLTANATGQPILVVLKDPAQWDALSDDGKVRLARCAPILVEAVRRIGRSGIGSAAEAAWLRLGGPATIADAAELADADRYWRLLVEHADEPVFDWNAFRVAVDKLFGEPFDTGHAGERVQIMTMHHAKGLEFDTVIVPGLSQPTGASDQPLLRWRASRSSDGGRRLLVAPINPQGSDADPQYEYLRRRGDSEERHELERLLYVTATRAKRSLHWIACMASDKPARGTSLDRMWQALSDSWPRPERPEFALTGNDEGRRAYPQTLQRLPAGWRPPAIAASLVSAANDASADAGTAIDAPVYDWVEDTARAVGIVAHDLLRRVGSDGPAAWSLDRLDKMQPSLRAALAEEGVPGDEIGEALRRVLLAATNALSSSRAAWFFDGRHEEIHAEFALTMHEIADGGDRVRRIVVDRTFIDASGVRWIIDFKTSLHRGADLEGFLEREVERHRPQLESYARAWSKLESRPIRVGVYWPLHDAWREWEPVLPGS